MEAPILAPSKKGNFILYANNINQTWNLEFMYHYPITSEHSLSWAWNCSAPACLYLKNSKICLYIFQTCKAVFMRKITPKSNLISFPYSFMNYHINLRNIVIKLFLFKELNFCILLHIYSVKNSLWSKEGTNHHHPSPKKFS